MGEHTYDWPRPAVTVDSAVFADVAGVRHVLLIKRGNEPFAGAWALPGGFVDPEEDLDKAAARELAEETGLRDIPLRQLFTVGHDRNDPRGWVVTIVYGALVDRDAVTPRAGDDAAHVEWRPVDEDRDMAFDHGRLVPRAARLVRG